MKKRQILAMPKWFISLFSSHHSPPLVLMCGFIVATPHKKVSVWKPKATATPIRNTKPFSQIYKIKKTSELFQNLKHLQRDYTITNINHQHRSNYHRDQSAQLTQRNLIQEFTDQHNTNPSEIKMKLVKAISGRWEVTNDFLACSRDRAWPKWKRS